MRCIRYDNLEGFYKAVAEEMDRMSEYLCKMDAELGDGDLGITMKKGFGALPDIIRKELENLLLHPSFRMRCSSIRKVVHQAWMWQDCHVLPVGRFYWKK